MPRQSVSTLPSLADDIGGLMALIARRPAPLPSRVELHVECVLADWRNTMDSDAYAARQDTMREQLQEGVEHLAEAAGAEGSDFMTGAAADHAKAAVALMRVALAAVKRGALVGAV